MFSGLVEAKSEVIKMASGNNLERLYIKKPPHFNDLKVGDSIAVNGVCLTLEKFDDELMEFAVAAETLQVTGWSQEQLCHRDVNLERSLKFGDRIHGHLVTGHVDSVAQVVEFQKQGESTQLKIKIPESLLPFVWKKGSLTLQGVSLTVNEVSGVVAHFCLIPETMRQTNLLDLKVGQNINVEVDYMARALHHWQSHKVLGDKL